jgi:hypothetical protein
MSGRTISAPGPAAAAPSEAFLRRNLAAIAAHSPDAARAIADAGPCPDASFELARDGLLTASLADAWGRRTLLASRHAPAHEADRFAESVDLDRAAVIVLRGFALGHHARSILARGRNSALLVIFEPDTAMLRAVLERQDHAGWLADPLVRIVTTHADAAVIGRALEGSEGLVALGLSIVDHPASARRIGQAAEAFAATLAAVVRSIRTNVVTTLAQADTTIRNQLMNLGAYARAQGIAPLRGSCAGRPAIVVSAGPSVRRNLHRLAEHRVRDRFVIIAVQTMLRPMLDAGIKPHFVTALDYHEISRRFYEGLTEHDVRGVTLVAEAKANPAILDAWPGALRCPADGFLDRILAAGPEARGPIRAGATVAHLAYYLARHLGCDPAVLIGQDLGFTDGQYYAAGAAIHTVWGSELGEFCTLETLEWQRIKRMGGRLITAADHLGRPVFTDDQMQTYRHQFERDFAADNAAGLRVVDATEGGVAKAGAAMMTLDEAIDRFGHGPHVELPPTPAPLDRRAERDALARLRDVRADVWKIAQHSRDAKALIDRMQDHPDDARRVNDLIRDAHEIRARVQALEPAFGLVHAINQRGTLRRARADRAIHLAQDDPHAEQRARMGRDAGNVQALAEAADELGELMDAAVRAHEGRAPKLTREAPARARLTGPKPIVWAAVVADPDRSDLGVRRDLAAPALRGLSPLRLTLERLARSRALAGVAVATTERGAAARAAGIDPSGGAVLGLPVRIIEIDDQPIAQRRRAIRGARAFTPHAWRGGAGGWSYADELVYPDALADVLTETNADALLLAGADWGLIDPDLCRQAVERFAEAPDTNRLVFSQAPVGLAPVLLERSLIEALRAKRDEAGSFASVGALLGYIPVQPTADPIAGPACLGVEPLLRDLGERLTLDTRARVARIAAALRDTDTAMAPADQIARAIAAADDAPRGPEHLVIELVAADGSLADADRAIALIRQAASAREDLALTLAAERTVAALADPLDHPELARIAQAARGAGALALHIRTPLLAGPARALTLMDMGLDAVSIDLVADDRGTFARLAGRDGFDDARRAAHALLEARAGRPRADGLAAPWLIARITRRDAVYEQLDALYDRWLMAAGAAVVDPLPEPIHGERIEPLPPPPAVAERLARRTMLLRASLATPEGVHTRDGLLAAWRRCTAREGLLVEAA